MTILVTGATGSIGPTLVSKFLASGYDLLLLVRNKEKAQDLYSEALGRLDIIEWESFKDGTFGNKNIDLLIHMAGFSSAHDDDNARQELIEANIIQGTSLIHKLCVNNNLKFVINLGSSTEYHNNDTNKNPTYFYSATKTAFKALLNYYTQKYQLTTIHTILYSVYGMKTEKKRIFDYILDAMNSSQSVKLSPGEQLLDFIHIEDVSSFLMSCVEQKDSFLKGQITEQYCGTGVGTTIKELACKIGKISNQQLNIKWGGLDYRERDTMLSVAPIYLNLIEWKPQYDIESGIVNYLQKLR